MASRRIIRRIAYPQRDDQPNRLEPDLAEEEGQLETLRVRLPLPFLGVYPHAATPESGASVLDWETLLAVGENRK